MSETNLAYVAKRILSDKCRYGESRHKAKIEKNDKDFIFSRNTYNTYAKQSTAYFNWLKKTHPKANTLKKAKGYIQEYIDRYDSAWTQATISSSLCKVYECSKDELGIQTKERHRYDIKRSRNGVVRDKHFSSKNNEEFIEFCKHTGLRKSEISKLKGGCVEKREDGYYITSVKGKGGKIRDVYILESYEPVISRIKNTPNDKKVFEHIPSNCDIHSLRAEYAGEYYRSIERDLLKLSRKEKYYCKKDKAGIVYDRKAMLKVSRSLGHNRIDVIARNYLY